MNWLVPYFIFSFPALALLVGFSVDAPPFPVRASIPYLPPEHKTDKKFSDFFRAGPEESVGQVGGGRVRRLEPNGRNSPKQSAKSHVRETTPPSGKTWDIECRKSGFADIETPSPFSMSAQRFSIFSMLPLLKMKH
ncbi:MAG: hypothetical protein IK066_05155 [Kiritimatiellae bacterium]|nr:hypothetical protein [Kiritimatiellia bacterium]